MKNSYDSHWIAYLRRLLLRRRPPVSESDMQQGWEALRMRLEEEQSPFWQRWWQQLSVTGRSLSMLFAAAFCVFLLATYEGLRVKRLEEWGAKLTSLVVMPENISAPAAVREGVHFLSLQPQPYQLESLPSKTPGTALEKTQIKTSPGTTKTRLPESKPESHKPTLQLLQGNAVRMSGIAAIAPPVLREQQQKDPEKKGSRFALHPGIAAAPLWHISRRQELTHIRPELGVEIGLIADYAITPRLHLNSGAFVMAQVSALSGQQTRTYNARFSNDIMVFNQPERIEGYLVILNVPLNLRYNWKIKGNQKWFTQIGVSNYAYLREQFFLKLDRTTINRQVPGWNVRHYQAEETQVQSGRVDMLSALNLSVGSEWAIGPRLSFQVEPFLHIPLRKLTSQEARFYTTGARLRLSFCRQP